MTNRTLRSLCSHDKWGIKLYMGWRKPHNVNPVTVESHKRLRLRAEKRSLLSPLRMQTTTERIFSFCRRSTTKTNFIPFRLRGIMARMKISTLGKSSSWN